MEHLSCQLDSNGEGAYCINRPMVHGIRHTANRTPSEDNWSIGLFFNLSDLGSLGLELNLVTGQLL